MNRRAAIAVVRATARALKAVGYYDAGHPILHQLQREVQGHLKEACEGQVPLTLASAGAKLLISETEPPLNDASAKTLASHLFSRSIVALKLSASCGGRDLSVLLQALAESPDKIRHAGGLKPLLEPQGTKGIEVFEVDFANLFDGKKSEIASGDPLVQKALGELLRFKENKERTGSALGISLDDIGSPESLGSLLDDLLEKAGPDVKMPVAAVGRGAGGSAPGGRAPTGGGPGGVGGTGLRGSRGGGTVGGSALAGISAEELGELASEAFVGTCEKLTSQAAPQSRLAETAKVLTGALARLNPEARFALLRQLGGTENGRPGAGVAIKNLSSQIQDNLIVGAISAALTGQQGDRETVSAIGTLIRQLRPIESERRKLLDALDQTFSEQRQKIDGMVWHELQASALNTQGLGMLEISFRQNVGPLAERAKARLAHSNPPPEVRQVVACLSAQARAGHAAKVLLDLFPQNGEIDPKLASEAKELIDAIGGAEGDGGLEQLTLLSTLLKRAEGQRPSSPIPKIVKELLAGAKGIPRALALLKSQQSKGSPVLGEALLEGLDGPLTIEGRKQLVAAFTSLDEAMLRHLRAKVLEAKPLGTYQIVLSSLRGSPASGLEFARQAFRNKALKSKESVLRALGSCPEAESVAALSKAAGCDGDEEAAKILMLEGADTPEGETSLRALQRAAIDALGATRSELAVPSLEALLNRRKLVGNAAFDLLRPAAAQALAANSSTAAQKALQAGRANKHAAIRDACVKAR